MALDGVPYCRVVSRTREHRRSGPKGAAGLRCLPSRAGVRCVRAPCPAAESRAPCESAAAIVRHLRGSRCSPRTSSSQTISPVTVAHPGSLPTVKQRRAAIRMRCDWLVVSRVPPGKPAGRAGAAVARRGRGLRVDSEPRRRRVFRSTKLTSAAADGLGRRAAAGWLGVRDAGGRGPRPTGAGRGPARVARSLEAHRVDNADLQRR